MTHIHASRSIRAAATTLAMTGSCMLAASPALGQTGSAEEAPVQYESLAFAPMLRLSNIGWDNNVFFVSEEEGPIGDFTATISPAARTWVRLPRMQLTSFNQVDFVYFQQLSAIRSVDTANNARFELALGRFTPFVGGSWINARHNRNFEIDYPVRRVDTTWDTGVDLHLSSKTSVGVSALGSREEFRGDTDRLEPDLVEVLGATSRGESVRMRYAVTPFTTIGAQLERESGRFPHSPERDSESTLVAGVVELNPRALISGRVEVGVRRRRFVDGNASPLQGTAGRLDLGYTLLGRTRFALVVQRDLNHSYRVGERDYLLTGLELSITHRLSTALDVRVGLARFYLNYGPDDSSMTQDDAPWERIRQYNADVGFWLRKARVGVGISTQGRTSDFGASREYARTRITSSLEYSF